MSTIHIILHGLIALAPTTGAAITNPANHMTALLVDARRQPPEYATCFASHQPMLVVKTPTTQECVAQGCTSSKPSDKDDCTCTLLREEVSLQAGLKPEKAASKLQLRSQPEKGIPDSKEGAADFSYVANLSQLGQQLDDRFLAPHPPIALIARMTFPVESVSACSLGTRPDEGNENIYPMGFRPLHEDEKAGDASQALAQGVVATFETDQDPIIITLTDFESGSQRKLTLKPSADGEYDVYLMNARHDLSSDDPCDDGVGRDFAFFYDLVKSPEEWENREIPHVKYKNATNPAVLTNQTCGQHFKVPNSHPICVMAAFVPSAP
jgi:hypothetical protein